MPITHRKLVNHFKKADPVFAVVIKELTLRELSPRKPEEYFEALVESIVSQQLSVKASDTIFKRFAALTPGKKFPTPQQVLKFPTAKICKCGLSKAKVIYIKDLAKKVLDKTVNIKQMHTWTDAEVIEHLTQVKGIGVWTAEMFLMFSLGREDVFSYGDLALRNAIRDIYKMKAHPTPAQAKKITDAWKPYRTMGSRYLWASLRKKQKAALSADATA